MEMYRAKNGSNNNKNSLDTYRTKIKWNRSVKYAVNQKLFFFLLSFDINIWRIEMGEMKENYISLLEFYVLNCVDLFRLWLHDYTCRSISFSH